MKKTSLTTAQQLASIIKSARDLMRKDKGLNGDLDRLPMLTWIMFLKFLDDVERMREEKAAIAGKKFRPLIEPPFRWRDWAATEDALTGDDLKAFINNEEVTLPDGSRVPGLFAYLRNLQSAENGNGRDNRDVIATIFREVNNRMVSGHLLREIINKINAIHFNSTEEMHTLSRLYESMLKEMRDAAGDSGEFYTPRAVVRFLVEVIDPRLGETVLDPACGTGGFLVEAFQHLEKQCRTVEDRQTLQTKSVYGGEAKPLPFLLAQMNLLLHGLEAPRVSQKNSLDVKLAEIGDKDRVDIILTNPPFGGEEERGILDNFPEDKKTAETALLFLQFIMRKLRRRPKPGRTALVVPDGILFGEGMAGRIKEELLENFNLHTIVRLPNGVFAPYTSIKSNLLFFDRSGPTKEIWYYEILPPEGRKGYTKTAPMQYEEFAECLKWWNDRVENDRAWRVNFAELHDRAKTEAAPHWEAARVAAAKAAEISREQKELSDRIQRLQKSKFDLLKGESRRMEGELKKLEAKRARLQLEESRQRETMREEQAAGDRIYWPIYNLDIKNPSSKQDYEHKPPETLVEEIIAKEQRIAEIMQEIKQVLAEGGKYEKEKGSG